MARALAALLTSSLVTILVGVIRQKAVALQVGPAGIGQLGLMLSLVGAAATIGGVGLATSGVQRVSVTAQLPSGAAAQRGLLWMTAALGAATGTLVYALTPLIGAGFTGTTRSVVALAAAVTVAMSGQTALLNGLGLLSRIAWINGIGAVIGTAVTVALLYIHPIWGVYGAVLAPLLSSYALGLVLQRGQGQWQRRAGLAALWQEVRPMLALGAVFAAGVGVSTLGQFAARWFVQREYGPVALGQYQAAWSVTLMYLGVLLNALSMEFFPRVSRVVAEGDVKRLNRVVSDQVRLILALAVPVICLIALGRQIVMTLLYTTEFVPAAGLLGTQLIGDTFKLTAWALSYTLLARNAKWPMFFAEVLWVIVYFALLTGLKDVLGFSGLGWAYVGAYAAYLLFVSVMYRRLVSKALDPQVWLYTLLGAAAVAVHVQAAASLALTVALGAVDLVATAWVGLRWWQARKARTRTAGAEST